MRPRTLTNIPAMLLLVLLSVPLGAARAAAAAPARWRHAAGPYGSNVHALAVAGDGAVYAGTTAGAVFKSVDGANSWFEADRGLGASLSIDQLAASLADPLVLYATTPAGIFKSVDGAASWKPLPAGSPRLITLAVAPSDASVVYGDAPGSDGDRVLRSGDGGATWQEADAGLPLPVFQFALVVDPHDPNTLYTMLFTTSTQLYRSTDGGAHWLPLPISGLRPAYSLVIDPLHPATLYAASESERVIKSTDGGVTWRSVSAGLALIVTHRLPFVVAVDAATSAVFVAVGTHDNPPARTELFRSVDGGASWRSVEQGDVVTALAFAPAGERAYAGTVSGMLASGDDGAHWASSVKGLDGTTVWSVLPDPHATGTIYAAATVPRAFATSPNFVVARSSDGGASWSGAGPAALARGGPVHVLAADPNTAGTVYAGTDLGLYRSTDAGATWSLSTSQLGHVLGIAVHPHHPKILYAVGYQDVDAIPGQPFSPLVPIFSVAKSTDGGATWTSLVQSLVPGPPLDSPGQFNAVTIDPHQPRVVYVVGDLSFKSVDGGISWTQLPLNDGVTGILIDPRSSTTLYASSLASNDPGFPSLERSVDGGATWTPASTGLPFGGVRQLVADPRGTLYAATDGGGVLVSADAGASWQPLTRGLTDLSTMSIAVDPLRPGVLYAGTFGHGLFVYTP